MMAAANIHYEIAEKVRGIAPGGIGAIHLLKRHLPYHESDHVLNIASNLLAGGSRLEHIEVRRNDEVYLDALGADRIPDPPVIDDDYFSRPCCLTGECYQAGQCGLVLGLLPAFLLDRISPG